MVYSTDVTSMSISSCYVIAFSNPKMLFNDKFIYLQTICSSSPMYGGRSEAIGVSLKRGGRDQICWKSSMVQSNPGTPLVENGFISGRVVIQVVICFRRALIGRCDSTWDVVPRFRLLFTEEEKRERKKKEIPVTLSSGGYFKVKESGIMSLLVVNAR